jgi:hypothetical protein
LQKYHGGQIYADEATGLIFIEYILFLSACQLRASQKALQLSWEVAPDVPKHVIGDAARLQQCILNLGQFMQPC